VESQLRRTKIERSSIPWGRTPSADRHRYHQPPRSPPGHAEGPGSVALAKALTFDQCGYRTDREGVGRPAHARAARQPRIGGVPTTAGRHGGRATRLEGAPADLAYQVSDHEGAAGTDRVRARLVDSQSLRRGSKFCTTERTLGQPSISRAAKGPARLFMAPLNSEFV